MLFESQACNFNLVTQATDSAQRSAHLSYSQVRQLRTCGWQFYLERVMRAAARPSVPAVAGSVIHVATEIVDVLLFDGVQADSDTLTAAAQADADEALKVSIYELAASGQEPSTWKHFGRQDLDWFRSTGIPNSIKAYVDWRLANPDWTLAVVPGFGPAIEVPFNYAVTPGRIVRGYIDRILTSRTQGGYYPLDIKSGLKPETDEQLGTYGAALSDGLGWNVERGYYLYGLKSGTASLVGPIDITHWTQARLGVLYESASEVIDRSLFVPNPGKNCFLCSVSASCEFAVAVI